MGAGVAQWAAVRWWTLAPHGLGGQRGLGVLGRLAGDRESTREGEGVGIGSTVVRQGLGRGRWEILSRGAGRGWGSIRIT